MSQRETLDSLADAFLECRDLGHNWTHFHDGAPVRERMVLTFTRRVLCSRCTTQRTEVLHVFRNGHVEKASSRYTYPEHYLLQPGQRSRVGVWNEVLRRSGVAWLEVS